MSVNTGMANKGVRREKETGPLYCIYTGDGAILTGEYSEKVIHVEWNGKIIFWLRNKVQTCLL